jgi:hypothetical protein
MYFDKCNYILFFITILAIFTLVVSCPFVFTTTLTSMIELFNNRNNTETLGEVQTAMVKGERYINQGSLTWLSFPRGQGASTGLLPPPAAEVASFDRVLATDTESLRASTEC